MRVRRSVHLFFCLLAFVELSCGPPIDEWTKDRPLANAAVRGDVQRLDHLIATGLDVNADSGGWTPLHWAAHEFVRWGNRKGQSACVRLLIAHGANVNARTETGSTPLEMGSWNPDCVGILLSAGARVNTVDVAGTTALMEAARSGSLDSVKRLLDAGADVNISDKIGGTALTAAVIHGTPEMVSVLLRAGADVNARNYSGETALQRLRRDPHPDWVDWVFTPGDARRQVREHQEMDQILRAAGGT